VLINITGSYDLTLFELDEAANRIREEVDPEANIIVGSTLDTAMEGTMRVSVVATGIDASNVHQETPVARRRLAEPLQPAAEAEPEPAPAEPPAMEEPQPEPSLFTGMEQPAAQGQSDDIYGAEPADDLPPPAYQPQAEQPAARHVEPEPEPEAEFVAPKPRAPGTPSPEALARLQAAVTKTPRGSQEQSPAAERPAAARKPAAPAGEKGRFGIGTLINRMAGHGHEGGAERTAQAARQQPPMHGYEDENELDPEQERIEIPAFLRRQAN
jgi:cell division protein FtsZ